jgi:hypothetical protein
MLDKFFRLLFLLSVWSIQITIIVLLVLFPAAYDCVVSIKNIRVLKEYSSSISIDCPLTTNSNEHIDLNRVRWLNENNDYFKPDQNVVVGLNNLIDKSKLNILLKPFYEYISCGYLLNNDQYVRLGFWKINFIGKFLLQYTCL